MQNFSQSIYFAQEREKLQEKAMKKISAIMSKSFCKRAIKYQICKKVAERSRSKNARSYGRVKSGLRPSAKEFFECDYTLFALCVDTEKQRMTAGKTATQARMGEHNFFSKKDNAAAWKDTHKVSNFYGLEDICVKENLRQL